MADALVDRGFVEAGYTYLNIDGERPVIATMLPCHAAADRNIPHRTRTGASGTAHRCCSMATEV